MRTLPHRRSPYGLDSPRDDDGKGLCNLDNADNFLITPISGAGKLKLSPENIDAKRLCWRCPIREKCLTAFERLDPRDRAYRVAGGHVWNRYGKRIEP